MPSFAAASFAVAGAIAATAPLIIHLLNRRRYRVVPWGAMDLLRAAIVRNRRMLQLRDLVLLALRTLCVLLFALALARPRYLITGGANDPNQPVHAVLIVDNSLSMGYQRLNGTLLDEARQRLNEFLERLPPGSRISVLPLCESSQPLSRDAHRTISDAREALARIEAVDSRATFSAAVDLAKEACAAETELPAKRVIFIGDQQRINWPAGGIDEELQAIPDLQIVQIALDEKPANAWVADFRVQDDIADVATPTIFTATVRYDGPGPRKDVEVTLSIDSDRVAAQTVDLEPGQSRLIRFAHEFDLPVEPGEPVFVAASVALAPDQLPADDVRHLAVPVVASLPVMFVDQYGAAGEDPQKDRYGETFLLRRLLAPISSRTESARQLISIRHVTADQIERQHLEDCRLVVVAGIESPAGLTPLLREYIEQGGRVVIAAGGNFDPVAWTNAAWLDGAGILPLPLKADPVGRLPDESAEKIEPFFLAPETMTSDEIRIEDASREELDDLYRTPLFFKAVAADGGGDVLGALDRADIERQVEAQKRREAARRRDAEKSAAASGDAAQRPADEGKANEPGASDDQPEWLLWAREQVDSGSDDSPEKVAARQRPRVLASFSNGVPFLVERRIGRGEVLFVSSGVYTGWNNLMRTNAVLVLDRL
ncbi:MAG: BatA domain-containing protein, partial [Deltaproteobacteria bacterium]